MFFKWVNSKNMLTVINGTHKIVPAFATLIANLDFDQLASRGYALTGMQPHGTSQVRDSAPCMAPWLCASPFMEPRLHERMFDAHKPRKTCFVIERWPLKNDVFGGFKKARNFHEKKCIFIPSVLKNMFLKVMKEHGKKCDLHSKHL